MVTVLHEGPPTITDRQRQVIELIAAGCSNEEVASRLGISPRTVESHVAKLYRKLEVRTRVQAVSRAVSLGLIGSYSIIMRSAILETRSEDYMTTARAKGLSEGQMLRSHAFPNALLPMVTIIAINLGYVVAGAITAEIVFNWPGLGTLTINALDERDYPVLQGIFLLLSVAVVIANLAADLLYGLLDPRVRA